MCALCECSALVVPRLIANVIFLVAEYVCLLPLLLTGLIHGAAGEVNEERLSALRKRAEVDAKCCIVFITHEPSELRRSLARLVFPSLLVVSCGLFPRIKFFYTRCFPED
jgi:hypothetical protein